MSSLLCFYHDDIVLANYCNNSRHSLIDTLINMLHIYIYIYILCFYHDDIVLANYSNNSRHSLIDTLINMLHIYIYIYN